MKLRQLWLGVSLAAVILCAGCAANGTDASLGTAAPSGDAARTFEIEETSDIKEIRQRGYLNVACKDDVPGFGLYDAESDTYVGGEIDLAYYIAAKIFDTSYEDAVERELVHFRAVETADRESVLDSGEVEYVIATYTVTDERREVVDFSDSYYTSAIGLMINASNADDSTLREAEIRSVSDLDGKKIGVITNSTTRADFLDYLDKNCISVSPQFYEYPTYDKLSAALEDGSIDAFSVDVTILNGYLTDSREILNIRFSPQKYGVAAQKGRDGLIECADTAIDELEYNGIVLFQ